MQENKTLPYRKFEEIIERLRDRNDFNDGLNKLNHKYNKLYVDFCPEIPSDALETIVVELIEKILELPLDRYNGSTLSWWLYERDFGRDFQIGDLIIRDQKTREETKPDLTTIKNLYEHLLWEAADAKKNKDTNQ